MMGPDGCLMTMVPQTVNQRLVSPSDTIIGCAIHMFPMHIRLNTCISTCVFYAREGLGGALGILRISAPVKTCRIRTLITSA